MNPHQDFTFLRAGATPGAPDPEVRAVAQRRTFTAEYKRCLLQEIDAATQPGQIGAILRREGLYSSTLASWRREREAALKQAFSKSRGPKAKKDPLAIENEKLRRQDQRLQEELRKAELIIEVQKNHRGAEHLPACIETRRERLP